MNKVYTVANCCLLLLLCVTCCDCEGRKTKQTSSEDSSHIAQRQIVNLYIENSGSMAGYFTGNSRIKDIIKDYYDRIKERGSASDTITLNYINNDVERTTDNIDVYLLSTQKKCTSKFTKIDDILTKAMRQCNDSTVNIVISDYSFTSNTSSLTMASSGITRIFTEQMKDDKKLCVAIYKYMSDFNGKYYPGGINCKKPLPFYLWIFGNAEQVKNIVNSPIKSQNCGTLILQPYQELIPIIDAKKKRMVNGNTIVVSEWDKDRNRDITKYSVTIDLDLSNVILSNEEIRNISMYQISEGYTIESITPKDNGSYSFVVSTGKPSPGVISIAYLQKELPEWVEKSDYTGAGIPKDSTTYGLNSLISGVYDAYHNSLDKIFKTEIILK